MSPAPPDRRGRATAPSEPAPVATLRVGRGTRLPATVRWARVPRGWKALVVLAATAVVVDFVFSFVGAVYGTPSRQVLGAGSSLDTSPSGTAALARLLAESHHPVSQLETPLAKSSLPVPGTLFVLDPQHPLTSDLPAIESYLHRGARVVLAGQVPPGVLHDLFGSGPVPVWQPVNPGRAHAGAPQPENFGAASVDSGVDGAWTTPGGSARRVHTLLAGVHAPLALWTKLDGGRLVLLGSAGALENRNLARGDNAAFALDLAGATGAPVSFDEYDHLQTQSGSGLAGLPGHWRAALLLGLAAVIVWMLSAAKRFGPPTAAARELVPPRIEYVEAMADLLGSGARARSRAAVDPLRRDARERLRRELHAQPDASDEDLCALASSTALPDDAVRCVLAEPKSEEDILALGSAYATLFSKRRWS